MRYTLVTALTLSWLGFAAACPAADEAQVKKLIKDLGSANAMVCIEALDALAELGVEAAPAVEALTKAIDHEDGDVCWQACRTLGAIGPRAADAVPALTEALKSDDPKVRAYAAYALGRIGKPALPAADALIANAFDKEALVRRATLRALLAIDPPQEKTMPLVMKILEEGDMSIIIPTLQTIIEQGEDAVPRLRNALKHKEAQYWACLVLAEIGPAASAAVPEITAVLKAPDPDTRLQALVALGEIGAASKPALGAILQVAQNDPFEHVRYAAVYAIGQIGVNDASQAALREWIEGDDEFLKTISAWALGRNNPDDKDLLKTAVQAIVSAFESEDVFVRQAAARAMVEFDVDRQLVAPLLVKALSDKDETVVANAIAALSALGPKALEDIDDALANPQLRHYALRLIIKMGAEAAPAVPAIIQALEKQSDSEDDVEFVREAHFALSAIGPDAAAAIPNLANATTSQDEAISASACYALGKIGPAARVAIPALQQAEKSDSIIVKAASVFAMWQIQPGSPQRRVKAALLLLKALDDDRDLVRAGAATMLGDLGNIGESATARLKKVRESDPAEIVRQAAADALKKL